MLYSLNIWVREFQLVLHVPVVILLLIHGMDAEAFSAQEPLIALLGMTGCPLLQKLAVELLKAFIIDNFIDYAELFFRVASPAKLGAWSALVLGGKPTLLFFFFLQRGMLPASLLLFVHLLVLAFLLLFFELFFLLLPPEFFDFFFSSNYINQI